PAGHLGEDLRRRELPEVRGVDRVPHGGILPPGTDQNRRTPSTVPGCPGRRPGQRSEDGDGPLAQPNAASGWGRAKPAHATGMELELTRGPLHAYVPEHDSY